MFEHWCVCNAGKVEFACLTAESFEHSKVLQIYSFGLCACRNDSKSAD